MSKSGVLLVLKELNDEVSRIPSRYIVNLLASLVLLEEELVQLPESQPPPPTKVWARRWAGGLTLCTEKPEKGSAVVSTQTMPNDGIWFQIGVK